MAATNNKFGIHSLATNFPIGTQTVQEIAEIHGYNPDLLKESLKLSKKHVAKKADEHPSDMSTKAAQKAMNLSKVAPDEIGMVIYTGLSRDYLPAWSVAVQVMDNLGIKNAIGYDLALGCVGTVIAIENACNHQFDDQHPYALILCAERWTHTLSPHKESPTAALGHGDGAGAILLGPDSNYPVTSKAYYKTFPELNNQLVIEAGGTVNPPSIETLEKNMHYKKAKKWNFEGIVEHYTKCYTEIIEGALSNNSLQLSNMNLLIMNQVPDSIRTKLLQKLKIDERNTSQTFKDFGHVGGADIIIALERALQENKVKKGNLVLASSTFSSFGAISVESKVDNGILFENRDKGLKNAS